MPSVVITDFEELLAPAGERLREAGVDFEVMPAGLSATDIARRADARVLLVGILPFGADALRELTQTRLIVRCGIGVDIVDVETATALGIHVANVPDYCIEEVADHAFALLLAVWRETPRFSGMWREQGWHVTDMPPVQRTRGSTLGVIGLGRIGAEVAKRAQAFGMRVLATDPARTRDDAAALGAELVELGELLEASDAVTLHCPLSPGTRHLIDADALALMREGSVLVNTSRGGLVDLDAVDAALAAGRLRGAALDVLDGEPEPPLGHPLLARENVLITPHVAWYSAEAKRDLGRKAAETAIAFLAGERPSAILNQVAV